VGRPRSLRKRGRHTRLKRQSGSTQAALFGCRQPSSASGAALSSTVPAGSRTGLVPYRYDDEEVAIQVCTESHLCPYRI
jgi:hypothetical protein